MNPDTQHLTILTGASRGMGLAMARQLLTPGRLLLCISRHAAPALESEAARHGASLVQWSQDLADTVAAAARLRHWLEGQQPPAPGAGGEAGWPAPRKSLNPPRGRRPPPRPPRPPSCAAKAGMDHFTRCS